MSKEYPCYKSKTGKCIFGGNKNYNYGFVRGMTLYCRKVKKWVSSLKECPLVPKQTEVEKACERLARTGSYRNLQRLNKAKRNTR